IAPVPLLVTVMVASGRTADCWSTTVPAMEPVGTCAMSGADSKTTSETRKPNRRMCPPHKPSGVRRDRPFGWLAGSIHRLVAPGKDQLTGIAGVPRRIQLFRSRRTPELTTDVALARTRRQNRLTKGPGKGPRPGQPARPQ